jgi:hypothetical protein
MRALSVVVLVGGLVLAGCSDDTEKQTDAGEAGAPCDKN